MSGEDKITESEGNWNTWSRHVLKELERLNSNYESINKELSEVKEDLAIIKSQQTTIGELKQWKKEMETEITPAQYKELKAEVKQLTAFKTVSTTVWVVVQVLFALIVAFKDKLFP